MGKNGAFLEFLFPKNMKQCINKNFVLVIVYQRNSVSTEKYTLYNPFY